MSLVTMIRVQMASGKERQNRMESGIMTASRAPLGGEEKAGEGAALL
jgi:hypothetical protein